jgi:hypothetical protein
MRPNHRVVDSMGLLIVMQSIRRIQFLGGSHDAKALEWASSLKRVEQLAAVPRRV